MAESKTYEGNGNVIHIIDPGKITRDECVALARCGAEAWNAWRSEFPTYQYKDNCVDFSDVDFSKDDITFEDFTFGDNANFKGAKFRSFTKFTKTCFGWRSNFEGALFGEYTDFEHAFFGNESTFDKASFGENTRFKLARLNAVSFADATFGDGANFDGAWFVARAVFYRVKFGYGVSFNGAQFTGESVETQPYFLRTWDAGAKFNWAQFGKRASFKGAQFSDGTSFNGAEFDEGACFDGVDFSQLGSVYRKEFIHRKEIAESAGLDSSSFGSISFAGAHFKGGVSFQGREFKGATDFGILTVESKSSGFNQTFITRFQAVPEFHECRFHQNTSFYMAAFPKPVGSEAAARAYCTLKLAFAQKQDLRLEQKFFKLELEEEAVGQIGYKRWLYLSYKYLSGFGFSLSRPVIFLLSAWVMAMACYAFQSDVDICTLGVRSCMQSISNLLQFTAFSIPGFEKLALDVKSELFSTGLEAATLFVLVAHKLITLLGFFLIGLALRNLFKMK